MLPQPHHPDYRAKLDANLKDLRSKVSSATKRPSPNGSPSGEELASWMPLSHSTGASAFLKIVAAGSLLSFPKLVAAGMVDPAPKSSPVVEETLDTADCVFTYAAPFRYPATNCGFLFKAEVERLHADSAVATPFDSGATIRFLRPRDSVAEQIAFVRRHEMPAPEYRALLAQVLKNCFDSPRDYVDGRDPDESWPVAVESGDWRRWTFEVRFQHLLELRSHLMAVFLPTDIATQETILGQIELWEAEGVDVVEYPSWNEQDTGSALIQQCIDYVNRLAPRGERAT